MNELNLTKSSTENQIRAYFLKVLELKQSNEQFPVDLDEVWLLVYPRKDHAVRELKGNFIQDVDYQVFPIFEENSKGRPTDNYKLSVSCMEFFIARKVQPVFEVYRSIFHQSVESAFQIPQTFSEALRLAADKTEENERLTIENRNKDRIIEENAPKVLFTNAVAGSKNSCLVGELAKLITQNGYTIGQNRLFVWMRENGYMGKRGEMYNIPLQQYVEQGLFDLKKGARSGNDGVMYTTITPKVTGKGQIYFVNRFLNSNHPIITT